jgi:hypothetical protein
LMLTWLIVPSSNGNKHRTNAHVLPLVLVWQLLPVCRGFLIEGVSGKAECGNGFVESITHWLNPWVMDSTKLCTIKDTMCTAGVFV